MADVPASAGTRRCGAQRRELSVLKTATLATLMVVGAASTPLLAQAVADPSFPFAGTYVENQVCKGDGSDPADKRVKISPTAIDSSFGVCALNDRRVNGNKMTVQVVCKDPGGGQLTSDITFTVRDANTLDFVDQYETYRATLHRCPAP